MTRGRSCIELSNRLVYWLTRVNTGGEHEFHYKSSQLRSLLPKKTHIMTDSIYVCSVGEMVLLQGLSAAEYNGTLAEVQGIQNGRVMVKLFHNNRTLLVKAENLLDTAELDGEDDNDPSTMETEGHNDEDDDDEDDEDENMADMEDDDDDKGQEMVDDIKISPSSFSYDHLWNENTLQAQADLSLGQFDSAKIHCEQALISNSSNWLALQLLGDVAVNCGHHDEAILHYSAQIRILMDIPNDSTVLTTLKIKALSQIAASKGLLGDTMGELETLREALAIDPINVHILANLGVYYMDIHDINTAIQYLQRVVNHEPRWALGRFHLARAMSVDQSNASMLDAAKEQLCLAVMTSTLRRSDESKARAAKTFMMIARLLDDLHQPTESQSLITRQLIVRSLLRSSAVLQKTSCEDNTDHDEHVLLALIFFQIGQFLERQVSEPSSSSPSSSSPAIHHSSTTTNGTGDVGLGCGAYDGAIGAYRRANDLTDDSSYAIALGNALRLRAHRMSSKDDCIESIRIYQNALQKYPENAALYRNLGCALMQKGDLPSAISAFTSSLTHSPEDDPWKSQITDIVASLTEKMRNRRDGTYVLDLPR